MSSQRGYLKIRKSRRTLKVPASFFTAFGNLTEPDPQDAEKVRNRTDVEIGEYMRKAPIRGGDVRTIPQGKPLRGGGVSDEEYEITSIPWDRVQGDTDAEKLANIIAVEEDIARIAKLQGKEYYEVMVPLTKARLLLPIEDGGV